LDSDNIKSTTLYVRRIALLFFLFLGFCACNTVHSQSLHTLNFQSIKQTKAYFRYDGDGFFIICGHRGGAASKGYPENSIPDLKHTLQATPAMFEVDPRLTKDSSIVMIHDATLDRVTTGRGKVIGHTLAEVEKMQLKDPEGNVTPYHLNTLQEMIQWAKGKTIIKLDVKDVPLIMKANKVKKLDAFDYVIFATHNAKQSQVLYNNFGHHILLAPRIVSKKALNAFEKTDIPWSSIMMVYIGPRITKKTKELRDLLHKKGVMVMISAATSYDKLANKQKRAAAYRNIIKAGFDILESNRPIEVAEAVNSLYPEKSKKYKFWKSKKGKE
jgi:glycerophosphoryl diester phosphodiesterase